MEPRPALIHLYDPALQEVFYSDGHSERVPEQVIKRASSEGQVEVVACWAKATKRIALQDELAMIPG